MGSPSVWDGSWDSKDGVQPTERGDLPGAVTGGVPPRDALRPVKAPGHQAWGGQGVPCCRLGSRSSESFKYTYINAAFSGCSFRDK